MRSSVCRDALALDAALGEKVLDTVLAAEVAGGDVLLVPRAGAVQSQIRLSSQALPRTDPRYPALQLANLAYGGYFSSRLVENIREDKGYTYGPHSRISHGVAGSRLVIDADVGFQRLLRDRLAPYGLDVVVADGAKFVAETAERFDLVIVDSSDPIGPAEILFAVPNALQENIICSIQPDHHIQGGFSARIKILPK